MSESNYCTCGECGHTWDNAANPTPAHRCPREADHAPTAHVVTLTLAVRMDEMDGTPEQSAEIAACIVEEAVRQHWGGDAEVVAMTADYASPTPTRWPSVAADESVVWYCGADGSWGGCLAGDLLIIPERALTPDENAALDGVTSSRWDDEPGGIIAAAIERSNR